MKQFSQEVITICPNEIPENLLWLPETNNIIIAEEEQEKVSMHLESSDFIVCVDGSNKERYGDFIASLLPNYYDKTLQIDHHKDHEFFSKYAWEEPNKISTTYLIYQWAKYFVEKNIISWNKELIYCLFTGIKTDSMDFTTPRVNGDVLRTVAELVDLGVKPYVVNYYVNQQDNFNLLKLQSFIISQRSEVWEEYKTVFAYTLYEDLQKYNLREADFSAGRVASILLSAKDVYLTIVAKESEDGYFRISFRSLGSVPANIIANHFGGGGHRNAAGANVKMTIDELKQQIKSVLPKIKEFIQDNQYMEL